MVSRADKRPVKLGQGRSLTHDDAGCTAGNQALFTPLCLDAYVLEFLIRLLSAFITHLGRMSASQAAGSIRTQARNRAAVIRFLAKLRWSDNWYQLAQLADLVLQAERRRGGTWVFIVDQIYCGQQGQKTENTFSRANYRPRAKKSKRRQRKQAKRSCHGLVMGLLISPSGFRIPCCRCYYTEAYSAQKKKRYRMQKEVAPS